MDAWSRFLETFFKRALIEQYSPFILKGVLVTVELRDSSGNLVGTYTGTTIKPTN